MLRSLPRWTMLALLAACGDNIPVPTAHAPNAFHLGSSARLAIDNVGLYWHDGISSVWFSPRGGGGAPMVLAAANGGGPGLVTTTTTGVFWSDNTGELWRAPFDGGPASEAAHPGFAFDAFAADDSRFVYQGDGSLVDVALATDAMQMIRTIPLVALALDGDEAWGTSCTGGVWHVSLVSGPINRITQDPMACALRLALDAHNVYYSVVGGQLFRVPRDGSASETEIGSIEAFDFAVLGSSVYAFSGGAIVRMPLDGSVPTPIVTTDEIAPDGIAVDEQRVYWTHYSELHSAPL